MTPEKLRLRENRERKVIVGQLSLMIMRVVEHIAGVKTV